MAVFVSESPDTVEVEHVREGFGKKVLQILVGFEVIEFILDESVHGFYIAVEGGLSGRDGGGFGPKPLSHFLKKGAGLSFGSRSRQTRCRCPSAR